MRSALVEPAAGHASSAAGNPPPVVSCGLPTVPGADAIAARSRLNPLSLQSRCSWRDCPPGRVAHNHVSSHARRCTAQGTSPPDVHADRPARISSLRKHSAPHPDLSAKPSDALRHIDHLRRRSTQTEASADVSVRSVDGERVRPFSAPVGFRHRLTNLCLEQPPIAFAVNKCGRNR